MHIVHRIFTVGHIFWVIYLRHYIHRIKDIITLFHMRAIAEDANIIIISYNLQVNIARETSIKYAGPCRPNYYSLTTSFISWAQFDACEACFAVSISRRDFVHRVSVRFSSMRQSITKWTLVLLYEHRSITGFHLRRKRLGSTADSFAKLTFSENDTRFECRL
jgi:hypothetical protein